MKLSEWAKRNGLNYQTVYRWYKNGTLPVRAYQANTGTIIIIEGEEKKEGENMNTKTLQSNYRDYINKAIDRTFDRTFDFYDAIDTDLTKAAINAINNTVGKSTLNKSLWPALSASGLKQNNYRWVELADKFVLVCNIAGFSESDVKITVKSGDIIINGNKQISEDDKEIFSEEHAYFTARYKLPSDVSAENISAKFYNGILQLTLPKKNIMNKEEIEIVINKK